MTTPAALPRRSIMTQNERRRRQRRIRMRAIERFSQSGFSPVNQTLRLLQGKLKKPRMRPGQLAQIRRRNIELASRGVNIRPMSHKNALDERKIEASATRRNRKPPNRRPPPHSLPSSKAHLADRQNPFSRSTNSARRREASNRQRRSSTRVGRG